MTSAAKASAERDAPTLGEPVAPDALDSLVTARSVRELQDDPGFRQALETASRERMAYQARMDATGRWLARDLGRWSLVGTAFLLDEFPHGLTLSALQATATQVEASSRGRVTALVNRLMDQKELVLQPGSASWVRRRLTITQKLFDRFRDLILIHIRATCRLEPSLTPVCERLTDDEAFRGFLRWAAFLSTRERLVAKETTPVQTFFYRDGGMLLLTHLATLQTPKRGQMLESSPFSRTAAADAIGISRAQLSRVLAEARAQGLMDLSVPGRITVSAALSDDWARTQAFTYRMIQAALIATRAAAMLQRPSGTKSDAPAP